MAEIGISLGINAGSQGVPNWVLNNAALDMYFSQGTYFSATGSPVITDLLTTTRASTGYAATAAGGLTLFQANTPRITDLGLLVEQAATNVVLWNRDLTNAAWTKSNITAALNQTGADGTANSATSLTATAGNGTCLQAITLASSARFQSAYVKRVTGTGTINMTMDNGATWTAITVTAAYTQLTIPTQTLANPTVGFRIVTSGDAIAVDLVGNETGTFATSPIATTTVAVTRAADVVTFNSVAPFANGFGAFISVGAVPSFASTVHYLSAASGNRIFYSSSNANLSTYNGTTVLSADPLSGDLSSGFRGAARLKTSDRAIAVKSGTVATDSNTNGVPATVYIGSLNGTGSQNAYTKRVAIFSTLTNAQIASLAALP